MADETVRVANDWVGNVKIGLVAWWIPQAVILATLCLDVPIRMVIWLGALAWMGTACLLNARRCGRTHCRFTGPYYLAMIVPVMMFGSAVGLLGPFGWLVLAALIILGGKIIWWLTERAWGNFQ